MTKRLRETAILIPTAGMEISRLGVFAGLFFFMPETTPLPYTQLSLSLLAALFVTRFLRQIRRRRITEVLILGGGFLFSLFHILRSTPDLPFAGVQGLSGWGAALGMLGDVTDSYHFFILCLWSLVFWIRGYLIGRGPVDYSATAIRFDGGLGILFFVFFIRLHVDVLDPLSLPLTAAFFLFGIVALYLSKGLKRDPAFSGSRSALGVLFPFILGFLLLGTGFYFLYPLFVRSAGGLYRSLKAGAAPLGPWLVKIIRFLFGFGFARPQEGAMATPEAGELLLPDQPEPGYWTQLLEKILTWGLFGVLGIIALGFAGWILYRLILRLASRADGDGGLPGLREFLKRYFLALWEALRSLIAGGAGLVRRFIPQPRTRQRGPGTEGFVALCRWGRLAGFRRKKTETPGEYGRRLARSFPAAGEDIFLLVGLAEEEFYGRRELDSEMRSRGRRARRGLKNPVHLPARLRARFRIRSVS